MRKLPNTSSLRNCVNSQARALVRTSILIKVLSQRSPNRNEVWDWICVLFFAVLICCATYFGHYNDLPMLLLCLVGPHNVTTVRKFSVHRNTVCYEDPPPTPAKNGEIPSEQVNVQSSHSGLILYLIPSDHEFCTYRFSITMCLLLTQNMTIRIHLNSTNMVACRVFMFSHQ